MDFAGVFLFSSFSSFSHFASSARARVSDAGESLSAGLMWALFPSVLPNNGYLVSWAASVGFSESWRYGAG